jgi:hypothetical protein
VSAAFFQPPGPKQMRKCAFCDAETERVFCGDCWSVVDGRTKRSFRNLMMLRAPKAAVQGVIDVLGALQVSGIRTGREAAGSDQLSVISDREVAA